MIANNAFCQLDDLDVACMVSIRPLTVLVPQMSANHVAYRRITAMNDLVIRGDIRPDSTTAQVPS